MTEVNTDRDLHVSFMLKSSTVDVLNVAQILWYQADQSVSSTPSTTVYTEAAANPTSWTLKQGYAAVPSDAAYAKFRFFGCDSSDPTSGTTWLDDVVIRTQTRTEEGMIAGNDGQVQSVKAGGNDFEYWAPKGHIAGLVLSLDADTAHDVNITAGEAADSSASYVLKLTAEITKKIDATFAADDDAGGMFVGSVANDTVYHIFAIRKDSDGTIDAGFDTSVIAANIPTGYTAFAYLGYCWTDGSANILGLFSAKDDGKASSLETVLSLSAAASSDIPYIPPWVKVITLNFDQLSNSGTDEVLVQVGDSGGLETSTYGSDCIVNTGAGVSISTSTSAFILRFNVAASVYAGTMRLNLGGRDSNTWYSTGCYNRTNSTATITSSGSKALSAALDRLQISHSGSDTFDAGSIGVTLEA